MGLQAGHLGRADAAVQVQRPPADDLQLTYIREGNQLYSRSTGLNVDLI